ncbi:PREDICTED: vomeronasal type-1 receptor 4 isoform X2 [Miniopterus natalensis]|uniref:vomeronasal type-1 receptor 4 isoform X2 n=1 Tax=Miniopterus natalensis TaxID=291302 RepID=UPI0007A72407|nr:PREDICTED: vomeronasal type-1 receptor 4 isoform X2 [Miniopterus natalensis]
MATRDLVVGTVFLLHTVIGVLGNFSLLYQYLFLHLTGCRLRPTDLIINNLIMANSSVLFSNGLTFTMTSFGWYHHLTDFMCRFYNYVRGVGRGVSIGTTCLLSIFQAITISPMNSRWAELKVKAPNLGIKNNTNVKSFGYCSSVRHKETEDALYAALLTSPDVLCFALMLWASGFMVFILYRHKQRVQHIHRACVSSGSSPESRATKSILLLVSTFVFLNTLSTIFHIFLATLNDPGWFVLTISEIFSLSFPSLSPFLIMSRDHRFSRLNFAWKRNMKSCNIMRNM